MNILEKDKPEEKKYIYSEKNDKNFIKIFNIDKNEIITIANLDKISLNPYLLKQVTSLF